MKVPCKAEKTLKIGGEKDAVLVISNDNSKAHGILMPVRNPINRD